MSPERAAPKRAVKAKIEKPRGFGTLNPATPIAELHCHLGGSVTPAIMWGIAHAQGIRLPSKDYWAFRKMITAGSKRTRSFNGYLDLFHWSELIQSSPIAVERSVYEVVAGAYRKNHITTMELRFNPMKRNRNGEQDLDHIIAAAIRGADRAALEYPVKPGIILILDREFTLRQNEIIVEKAIAWASRGIVGIDIAGRESANFKVAEYKRMFRAARKAGLGITVHTGESGPVSEMLEVVKQLEPDRIGHGVKGQGRIPRRLGTENFDHAAARQTLAAERLGERERASGNAFDFCLAVQPQRHDRPVTKLFFNLLHGGLEIGILAQHLLDSRFTLLFRGSFARSVLCRYLACFLCH